MATAQRIAVESPGVSAIGRSVQHVIDRLRTVEEAQFATQRCQSAYMVPVDGSLAMRSPGLIPFVELPTCRSTVKSSGVTPYDTVTCMSGPSMPSPFPKSSHAV